MKEIVEVAVGLPIFKTFHYRIPEKMKDSLGVGMRVLVPFKGRKVTGFSINLLEQPPKGVEERLREVEDLLDEAPLIDPQMLRFYRWISDYYLYPLGEVIKTGLPPGLQLKSELTLSLTQNGLEFLAQGGLEPIQEKVFKEIGRCGRVSLKKVLKRFLKEVSRSQLFSWKRKGLLNIDAEIEGKEVKPKFEKVVQYQGGESPQPISKKQAEILKWVKERGEISYSELSKRFKSPSKPIQSLQAKGFLSLSRREVCRDLSVRSELKPYPKPEPTLNQEAILGEILKGIRSKRFSPFLIYGVTGSGKTEIYLRAIEEVLIQGQEAIVLVPEISLTPQLLSRFIDRFGENLALLHSGLGRGERYDQWRRIWKGEVKIAIGARSAIFAPFKNVGIIIVDEEHDPSYKQEEKLKYHARDVAVVRAKQAEATLLLGSATPSLESFYNAEKGKFHLLNLPERIEGRPLPRVEVVDVKKEGGLLSEKLRAALQKNIEDKKQSLLFLNRRGFANFILCPDCGLTFKCPNCSVTLTYHLRDRSLRCHYCDYRIQAPGDCPKCQGHRLQGMGIGTERLEQEIKSLFPGAHVERMDRDTTSRRRSHLQILKRLESGSIDILVGTQMIVKGHDFPNVTFVGVVSADTSLHFPDFRSSERTFQLLTQVAGRAGRGEFFGEVVIQTFNPDHYSILRAKDHDYIGFYQEEIQFRKALEYPPFSRFINFRLVGNSEKRTKGMAEEIGRIGQSLLKKGYGKGIEILGPSMAPFAKMRGKFRWQMLAKGKSPQLLHQFAKEIASRMEAPLKGKGVNLDIDVDPISIL
ncbi:MAG: primosomal protein N' [Deltaproteobacteria bacterium CG_4_8_14_3_um_filter_45_9]|nr:MAG: primosomal protein N' [Deltaproteobacteria bacterium CG03_land_8_20_14_0_80_45_14]PIX23706.1 MAG: primosomal protein N' [Deltaproteobacteria bacterium CG_4_8_14_3_um_filter_45_9]